MPFLIERVGGSKAAFAAVIAQQVKMLTYFLMRRWDLTEGKAVAMKPGDAAALVNALDLLRLANLKLVRVGVPRPKWMNDATYQKNTADRASFYGADAFSERVALVEFEGETYVVGFQLMRFAQSWTITAQWSPLEASATGVPWPMSPPEFDNLLD